MSILSKVKEIQRKRAHKQQDSVANRQMQEEAQRDLHARLELLEIRLRNEGRKR